MANNQQNLYAHNYTGGVFEAMIHFSSDYNYVAPKIQFLTIPFHPNGKGLEVQYTVIMLLKYNAL